MADTFLNSPASHENNLSYHNMLHFIIGQNKEYLRWLDPVFLGGVPSYFEALRYPHLYFYRKSNT